MICWYLVVIKEIFRAKFNQFKFYVLIPHFCNMVPYSVHIISLSEEFHYSEAEKPEDFSVFISHFVFQNEGLFNLLGRSW